MHLVWFFQTFDSLTYSTVFIVGSYFHQIVLLCTLFFIFALFEETQNEMSVDNHINVSNNEKKRLLRERFKS